MHVSFQTERTTQAGKWDGCPWRQQSDQIAWTRQEREFSSGPNTQRKKPTLIALADDRLAPRSSSPRWMYPKPYNPTVLSFPSTDANRFAVFVSLGFCLSFREAVRDHSETPLVPKVGCAF